MRKYTGFEPKRSVQREVIPAGGYVAKIKGADEKNYKWGSVLLIHFDISEGEYKDFFTNDYRAQQNSNGEKKWRGTYRLSEPKDDGSEKDEWTKRTFNSAVACIEESNPGYHWDWTPIENGDFTQLRGKTIGVLFRNREYGFEDNTGKYVQGWTTECCSVTTAADVRDGKFKMPKDKPLSGNSAGTARSTTANFADAVEEVSDDDLPF